jgi:hypothetical protein
MDIVSKLGVKNLTVFTTGTNIWSASMRALVGWQSRWPVNVTHCTLIGYRPALHARLATINRYPATKILKLL